MTNLSTVAYQSIKHNILSNVFAPNEYLEEKKLCELLGISRTPIRSALVMLEWENLVYSVPKKGTFVTNISVQDINDAFQARFLFEPIALTLSAGNLDDDQLRQFKQESQRLLEAQDYKALHEIDYDLHNYLHSRCNNQLIIQMMKSISDRFQRIRTQSFYQKERTEKGATEHIELLDLLLDKEFEAAIELLRKHIQSTQNYYFKSME